MGKQKWALCCSWGAREEYKTGVSGGEESMKRRKIKIFGISRMGGRVRAAMTLHVVGGGGGHFPSSPFHPYLIQPFCISRTPRYSTIYLCTFVYHYKKNIVICFGSLSHNALEELLCSRTVQFLLFQRFKNNLSSR